MRFEWWVSPEKSGYEEESYVSNVDSFGAKGVLDVNGAEYEIYRLNKVEGSESLPYSLKVLLENLLRTEDGHHAGLHRCSVCR